MYKDKDKQRESGRERVRRYRDKQKGVTSEGVTCKALPIDKTPYAELIGDKICVIPERTAQGNIRVSKPGDPDYVPQCETTRAFIEGRPKRPETGKRGKDIKCFADLPLDVQQTIDSMSTIDGKIDQTVKANRTAIAISYQHLFPDRYYSQGLSRTSSTKGVRL